mgnify:CR=1 FL=1
MFFDFDSFVVKAEFQPLVEAHGKYLAANSGRRITVEGNTDERGGREYNLALGQKRAEAVVKSLALLGVTDAQMEALRTYFGFDKPLYEQYWIWLTSAVRGDFGFSVRSGIPVLPEILARFPLTFELAVLAMLIATAIGIPIGVIAAVKREATSSTFNHQPSTIT